MRVINTHICVEGGSSDRGYLVPVRQKTFTHTFSVSKSHQGGPSGQDVAMLQKKIAELQDENTALRSQICTCGEGGSSGQQRPAAGHVSAWPAAPKSQGGGKKKKCPHGRRKHECVACGGASICEHSKRRSSCKKCGGASICEHGRERSKCKTCGGASICEHGRERSSCRACGGASICEHDRLRSKCKTCIVGADLCQAPT